jgi:hypothetical protein
VNIEECKKLYDQAKSARKRFDPVWSMNLAYFEGEQWVAWAGGRLYRPDLSQERITLTDNRIQPAVRTEVAKLTKHRPTFICTPRTSGDDDISAAEMAEQILEYQWTHLELQDRFPRALLWSRTACAGFLKVIWDKSLGDGTEVLVGPDGQPIAGQDGRPITADIDPDQLIAQLGLPPGSVKRERVNQGDIRAVVRSPFQIFPDPLAETFADVEWLIEESIVSQDYVEERYGKKIEPDTPANPGLVQAQLNWSASDAGGYKGVKVFELWRKPCRKYPNGFTIPWTGREILEEGHEPFDPMPYVMFSGIDVPGRFWPTSITEQLRDPQTELNKTKSQIAENRNRIGNPTVLASKQAIGDPEEFERQMSQPGGVMYYDDTSQNATPAYLEAPQMPQYVTQEIDRIEASIQEISGQHEVSSAQVPAGVTAASAINLLQEADDTRLGPAITNMEGQLAQLGRKILRLVAKFYDDQRTIALAGENKGWEIFDFKGAMLRDHTHVDVEAGSTFPRSLAAKQAGMESMLTTSLQNGIPLSQKNLAKYFRAFQIGGLEHLVDDFSLNEQQIDRENRQLTLGQQTPINEYDDDEAHIEGHQDFQKQFRYQRLAPPLQVMFEAHVDAHRQRLADQQFAEQQAQMMPQLAMQGQQMQLTQATGEQQMAQKDVLHQQRLLQGEELHQQRLQQAAQQPQNGR